jgi:type III secretion protein L
VTGVIKSGAAGFEARVRPLVFDGAGGAAAPASDPELILLRERVLDLEVALAERDATAERLIQAVESAYGEGEAAGREAGRAEADARRAEALERLKENADRAVGALEERLLATDRLAALLARNCLDKLFGASGDRAELVQGLIRHQLDTLRQETIVEIHVSADDFDPAAAAAAAPACMMIVSDSLASGDCTIRLQLGALDIGLGQQWEVLRGALDGMIVAEAAA